MCPRRAGNWPVQNPARDTPDLSFVQTGTGLVFRPRASGWLRLYILSHELRYTVIFPAAVLRFSYFSWQFPLSKQTVMSLRIRPLFALFFFSLGGSLYAQHAPVGPGGGRGMNLGDHLLIKEAEDVLYGTPGAEVVGSPYLSDQFIKGNVYSSKGTFGNVEMRYNIYKDYIEFRQSGLTYILDPSREIIRVDLGDYSLVTDQVDLKGKSVGFYVLLDSGKVTLVSKKSISFTEARPAQALESSATPAKFSAAPDTHYYKIGNGPLIKIGSLKKMIVSFPDKREELQAFASREKISARKQDELVRLVRYYNSL